MSQGASSQSPITQIISAIMDEHGFSRIEFIHALGYHNTLRGLSRLDPWLDRGEGYNRILNQIAAVYPAHAEALTKAIAATAKVKAAEAQAAFLERCKAERESFTPYIHVDGEKTVPNGITIFGITGGHERWTTIRIPKSILKLPVEELLTKLPKLMASYRRRYDGACPFFGKLTGFKFVRLLDYFQLRRRGPACRACSEAVSEGELFGSTSIGLHKYDDAAREIQERERRRFRPFIWIVTASGARTRPHGNSEMPTEGAPLARGLRGCVRSGQTGGGPPLGSGALRENWWEVYRVRRKSCLDGVTNNKSLQL